MGYLYNTQSGWVSSVRYMHCIQAMADCNNHEFQNHHDTNRISSSRINLFLMDIYTDCGGEYPMLVASVLTSYRYRQDAVPSSYAIVAR